jgi:hypothetical protein
MAKADRQEVLISVELPSKKLMVLVSMISLGTV